jgi:hypothetical protein
MRRALDLGFLRVTIDGHPQMTEQFQALRTYTAAFLVPCHLKPATKSQASQDRSEEWTAALSSPRLLNNRK